MQTYQISVSRGGGTHLCYASSMAVAIKRLLDGGGTRSDGGCSTSGSRPVVLDRGQVLELTVQRIA